MNKINNTIAQELEIKENVEDVLNFNIDEHKRMISGTKEDVLVNEELAENYVASEEDDDLEDTAFDRFLEKLQQCVAEDDAVIILEAGNEKMRYVVGSALIVTNKACEYLDIAELAEKRAAELLAIPSWKTRLMY